MFPCVTERFIIDLLLLFKSIFIVVFSYKRVQQKEKKKSFYFTKELNEEIPLLVEAKKERKEEVYPEEQEHAHS